MSVDVHRLPQSKVELDITVEPAEMEGALHKAYTQLANEVRIPGFRKGKAPRAMVERAVGQGALFQEAVEIAVGEAYQRALDEHALQPLTQPEINLADSQNLAPDATRPLRFTATVPVRPLVTLGDYNQLEIAPPSLEISPEEIDRVLNRLQEQNAPWQAVDDQPTEVGNQVTMALKATIGDETLIDQDSFEYVVRADESPLVPIPLLSEHLLGSTVGQDIAYDTVLADDYRPDDYAGKTMQVVARVLNIERKSLPDLDDDFARALGSYESLDEVRDAIKQSMAEIKQRDMLDQYVSDVIQHVVDLSQIEVPDVLVEEELDLTLSNMRSEIEAGRRMTLDQYLRIIGKTLEDLRTELRESAESRVRSNLVLDEVGRQEGIQAPAGEVEQELLAMAGLPTLKNRTKRRVMTSPAVRERVATRVSRRYTLLRLLQIVAPPAPTTTEEPEVTLSTLADEGATEGAIQEQGSAVADDPAALSAAPADSEDVLPTPEEHQSAPVQRIADGDAQSGERVAGGDTSPMREEEV